MNYQGEGAAHWAQSRSLPRKDFIKQHVEKLIKQINQMRKSLSMIFFIKKKGLRPINIKII